MELLDISSNWLCSKPVKSCAFVRYLQTDLDETEDIESLLENSDNCIYLCVSNDASEDDKKCKIFVNVLRDESESGLNYKNAKINSFSILCSAKLIEIHGNHTEYITTLTNEFIEESEDISMYRNDYKLTEKQSQITLTLKSGKNCSDMWVYAILINLTTTTTTTPLKQTNNFSSNDMLMAMSAAVDNNCFSQNSVQFGFLLNQFSNIFKTGIDSTKHVKSCDESAESEDKLSCESNTSDDNCMPATNACIATQCSQQLDINNDTINDLRLYIDSKFNEFENKIDNKLETLENRLIKHINTLFNDCQKKH